MFKPVLQGLTLAGMLASAWAQPYETAKVISATPVITQVPHQVCDKTENQSYVVTSTPSCTQQLMQVTAYQVEYELNGKRYTAQLPQDPGKTLAVQVAPVPVPSTPIVSSSTYSTQVYTQPPVYAAPPVYAPPPVYMAPYPYGYPVAPYGYYRYPPVGINLGFEIGRAHV